MILDGVLYSVIRFGRVILCVQSNPLLISLLKSSNIFSDLFWSSMEVRSVSPSIICY